LRRRAAWLGLALGVAAGCAEGAGKPLPDNMAERAAPCMSCHGKQGRATRDGYYPRIAGKPAGYLYNQLRNFREGRRQQYPLMGYMVRYLSDDYLHELAAYFSSMEALYPPPPAIDVGPAVLARGRMLALHGDPGKQVPACIACHGSRLTGVAPAIPGLLGLPRDYLNAEFGAWREGSRHAAAPDCMAVIAKRLTPDDISAASAWLAVQPLPADTRPAPPSNASLPLACGSVAAAEVK
jgi:cytochrome c553